MARIENPHDIDWEEVLPPAFLLRMQRMLGSEYEAFLASYREERRPGLRLNTLKKGWEKLEAAIVSGQPSELWKQEPSERPVKIPWVPHGFYYSPQTRPGKHPFHDAGVYYIQEPSAMAVAALSGVKPGQWVLDLCAAPGGKSTQLASMLQGKGLLVSNEIHPDRAKILSQNIERMGIRNAVVTNETPEKLAAAFPAAFDTVVVDAPCSGEGMFRKEEAAIPNWSPENVIACAERQREILDFAAEMTAEGGTLVYSTCTFAPEEDEENAAAFLERHPEFVPVDLPAELGEEYLKRTGIVPGNSGWVKLHTDGSAHSEAEAEKARIGNQICAALRLWPHRLEGEGHFLAVFRKGNDRDVSSAIPSRAQFRQLSGGPGGSGRRKSEKRKFGSGKSENVKREGIGVWQKFAEESLTKEAIRKIEEPDKGPERFVFFGNELYIMPYTLDLQGLRVLRPGLHLGTVRKDRFEPSHALALALSQEDVNCCAEAGKDIWRYLHGESLTAGETVMLPEKASAADGGQISAVKDGCRIIRAGGESGDGGNRGGSRGWCLITAGGFSVGWGKLVGSQIKNHYPRGLRRFV